LTSPQDIFSITWDKQGKKRNGILFRNSLDFFREKCYNSKLYMIAGMSAEQQGILEFYISRNSIPVAIFMQK